MRRALAALVLALLWAAVPATARAGAARGGAARAGALLSEDAPDRAAPEPRSDPRSLVYPPLQIAFPKPEKFALPNGLVFYFFRDTELPIVDLAFYLKGGTIYDPPEKVGRAGMAAHLMRTGGAGEMTPDEADEALEFMAARAHVSASDDSVNGSLSALKAKFPEALRIFARMLMAPRFDAARLEVERAQSVEEIRRRWDDPGSIADLHFRLLVYGASSPWARLESLESIARLTRQDLVEFHRNCLRPGNMIAGVAGDFEPAAMKRLLRETFGAWKDAKVALPAVPKIEDRIPVGAHLVERPITQSSIEIGHLGVNRFDPDKFALKILSFILGSGGFSSRLMKEVRSTRGLAYSVGGGVGTGSDRGLFEISCETKSGSTVAAIKVIRDIVRTLRDQGPTEEEVRRAKESEINSFVFSVEGTTPFMQAYLFYRYYGYPADFLQTYRDALAKVTREDVIRAARAHIDPDRLVVLVVGNPKEFDAPLESIGLGEPKLIRLAGEAAPRR